MPTISKIGLYDFAKHVLGGKEPKYVTIYKSDKKTIITREYFNLNSDLIQSVDFTISDFPIYLSNSELVEVSKPKVKSWEFPGAT